MPVGAVRAAADVDVYDAVFTRVEIIWHAERRRELDGPIAWFESGVAGKEFETELNRFGSGELFRATEEFTADGIDAAHVGRCRCAALFDIRRTHGGQNQEQLVAFDRVIAFEDVLVVRVPPASSFEWHVAAARAAIAVTIILGKRDAPAIGSLALRQRR